ncbi:MAG: DUF6694 family lipoprotein, partial [Pseudomonadota bacterium]
MNRSLAILLLTLFFSACSDPQIDTSSNEAIQESLKQVRSSLRYDEHRLLFDESWRRLTAKDLSLQAIQTNETSADASIKKVSGKTAEGVIKAGALEIQKLIEQLEQEVEDLEKAKTLADQKIEDLNKVRVSVIEAVVHKSPLASPVVVKLRIKNNTKSVINSVVMHAALKGMGNDRPWQEDKAMVCLPPGGLQPWGQVKCDAYPQTPRTWLPHIHK